MYLTNDSNKDISGNNKSKNETFTKRQLNALNILDKNCDAGDVESCYFSGSHNIRKGNPIYFFYHHYLQLFMKIMLREIRKKLNHNFYIHVVEIM